jgi:hypothetical protein
MYDYGVPIAEARKIEGRPVVNCYTYTNKEREGKGAHCGLFENLPTNPKYTFDREVTKSVIFSNCYQSEGVILRMRAPDEDTIVKDASGYWREQLEVFNASVVREKNAKTDGRTCFQGVGATSEFFGLLETGDFKVFNIDANNPI